MNRFFRLNIGVTFFSLFAFCNLHATEQMSNDAAVKQGIVKSDKIQKQLKKSSDSVENWTKNKKLLVEYAEAHPKEINEILKAYLEFTNDETSPSISELAKSSVSDLITKQNYSHIRKEAIDSVVAALSQELAIVQKKKDPLQAGNTYYKLGLIYKNSGKYSESIECLSKALEIRKKELGQNHLDVADTLQGMGMTYLKQSKYSESLKCCEQAMEIQRICYGTARALDIAFSLRQLGEIYQLLGMTYNGVNYSKALECYNTALNIFYIELGKNHAEVENLLTKIATLYMAQTNYTDALKSLNLVLETKRKKFGEEDPRILNVLQNIGFIYLLQSNYAESLKYYKQSLKIKQNKDAEGNLSIAKDWDTIGVLEKNQGCYSDSLLCFQQALKIRRDKLGENHRSIATIFEHMGNLYIVWGKNTEALKVYTQALKIRQNQSTDQLGVAKILHKMGTLYREQANYDEALKCYGESLNIRQRDLKNDDLDIAYLLHDIGVAYSYQRNDIEASKYYKNSLDIASKTFEILLREDFLKEKPRAVATLRNIGVLFIDAKEYEKALQICKQGLSIARENLGEDHPVTLALLDDMGELYRRQKAHVDALACYKQMLELTCRKFGEKHPDVASILLKMGKIYSAQKNHTDAQNLNLQALKIQQERMGRESLSLASVYQNIGDLQSNNQNYSEAISYLKDAVNIYEKYFEKIHPYTLKLYLKIAKSYEKIGNMEEANRYYEKQKKNQPSADSQTTVIDSLWKESRTTANSSGVLKKYCDHLANLLKEQKPDAVELTMKEMHRFYRNSEDLESDQIQSFDALENALREKKSLPEYFLFLDGFTKSGFSEDLAEQRKNYFGNLEDQLQEINYTQKEYLPILCLLASNYLQDETFFADGKTYAEQAVSTADERKDYTNALELYRVLLRQQLRMNDEEFSKIQKKAEDFARRLKQERYANIFELQKKLYEFHFDNSPAKAGAVISLLDKVPVDGSAELWSYLESNRELLNSGNPEILRLLKKLDPAVLKMVSGIQRRNIAFVFENAGDHTEAKRWFGEQLTTIDKLLYLNASSQNDNPGQVTQNAKLLAGIVPEPFKMDGSNYSKEDMDLLQSVTKCRYAKLQVDDSVLFDSAKHAEEQIASGKCDKQFVKVLQNEVNSTLCDYYYLNSEFDEAMEKVSSLLEAYDEKSIQYPWILVQKGLCHLGKNENKEAADIFQKVGEKFHAEQKRRYAATAYRNFACALYRMNKYDESLNAMRQCFGLGCNPKNPQERENQSESDAILITELSALSNDKKKTRKEKEEAYQTLVNRAQEIESPHVRCEFLLASVLFRIQIIRNPDPMSLICDLEDYFKYKSSIAKEEWLRTPGFLPDGDEIARKKLLSLLKQQDDVAKLDYWNKKFEQNRVRSILVSSSENPEDAGSTVSELAMLEIIDQFQSAKEIVEKELKKPESEQDKQLLQTATSTRRRLETLFEMKKRRLNKEKQEKFAALATDTFVIPADALSQLSSALEPDTVCLQFIPMDDEILIYLVAHNSPPILQTVSLKKHSLTGVKFQKQLQKLRMLLQSSSSSEVKIKKELKTLHNILMADLIPAQDKLGAKNLLVNSMGILRYIPFAALYDGKQYLVEKYQVTNATGQDLVRLSKAPATRDMSNVKAVVFANPDGSLPSAQKEGENVASLFQKKQVFVGPQATIGEQEALVGNVNFLHLATHGVIDSEKPQNSFIMLANGTKWRYCDMMGFNIENVDSIVLSACNSAVSEKATGGEIEGMAYQLLRKSPSGSVLASLWKVDDKATSALMNEYYSRITDRIKAQHKLDRGGALREAQLKLLHSSETAKPYYWAAFTLFGDYR